MTAEKFTSVFFCRWNRNKCTVEEIVSEKFQSVEKNLLHGWKHETTINDCRVSVGTSAAAPVVIRCRAAQRSSMIDKECCLD